ncbi:MAG: hypothetical protein WAN48_12795 [Actinomycetes bacterium]
MYGTVMIARTAVPVEQIRESARRWTKERGPSVGYVDEWVMTADDGRMVMAVRFESKEAYQKLADDPVQAEWWSTQVAPLLEGEPEWIDGTWETV